MEIMRQFLRSRRLCLAAAPPSFLMDSSDYDLCFPEYTPAVSEPAAAPAAPPSSPAPLITRRTMPGTSIRRLRNRSSAWPRRPEKAAVTA